MLKHSHNKINHLDLDKSITQLGKVDGALLGAFVGNNVGIDVGAVIAVIFFCFLFFRRISDSRKASFRNTTKLKAKKKYKHMSYAAYHLT